MNLPEGLLIDWAEVGARGKSNLEEEVLCKDVQEGLNYISVMLDLAEASFYIIDMDDNAILWVADLVAICADEDAVLDRANPKL